LISGHQVAHQVLAVDALLHADGRIAHLRLLVQTRFDFPSSMR
jgi:hypothetical protein